MKPGISRTDTYKIDPKIIKKIAGLNKRKDFNGHEDLVQSIIKNGVMVPLIVQGTLKGKNPSKTFGLVSGERRWNAAMEAIKRGHKIDKVPAMVVKEGLSQAELLYLATIPNDGKPFTLTEDGETYKQLMAYGATVKEVSERIGKSIVYIQQRVDLVTKCSIIVQEATNAKQITMDAALNMASKSKGDVDTQNELLSKYIGTSSKTEKKKISDDPKKVCKTHLKQLGKIKSKYEDVTGIEIKDLYDISLGSLIDFFEEELKLLLIKSKEE